MNITMRKLALLEQNFVKAEEEMKVNWHYSNPVNSDLRKKVTELMDKMRAI